MGGGFGVCKGLVVVVRGGVYHDQRVEVSIFDLDYKRRLYLLRSVLIDFLNKVIYKV